MRRLVMLSMLLCLTAIAPSFGASLQFGGNEVDGLTDAQAAKLQAQAADLAQQNSKDSQSQSSVDTIEKVNKYVELGQSIGAGLAATAKQMGVAVNQFATTPVGKLAMFIIIIKLIGWQFLHITVGLLWFLVVFPTWLYLFRRICLISETDTEYNEKGKRARKRVKYMGLNEYTDNWRIAMFCIAALLVAVGMITLFS